MRLILLQRVFFVLAAAVLAGVLSGGCGSDRGLKGGDSSGGKPVVAPALELPAPSQLALLKRGISADTVVREGSEFDQALPSSRVSANATDGEFSPVGGALSQIAYAAYTFDTTDFTGNASIRYAWTTAPDDIADCFIAVANFNQDAWEWHSAGAGGSLSLGSLINYASNNTAYVVVALRGNLPAALDSVQLGSPGGYDEQEPNDSFNEPETLPNAPVEGFKGSLGMGPGYPGQDGDCEDWYLINAPAGKFMTIVVLGTSDGTQDMVLELRDPNNLIVGFPTYPGLKPATIEGVATGGGGDFKLGIYCDPLTDVDVDWGDYLIYVHFTDAANAPPVSSLAVSPRSGPAPLMVSLDASASYDNDPGDSVVRYEWDFEGDGVFDLDSGTDSTVDHTYSSDGIYHPTVKVYDTHGAPWFNDSESHYPPGTRTVTVGDIPYDEREDNDFAYGEFPNPLPTLPFATWTGNIGLGSDAYDGDGFDYFTFNALTGEKWSFILDYTPTGVGSPVTLGVSDPAFDSLGQDTDSSRCIVGITAAEDGLYKVGVSGGKLGDYNLSCIAGLPPTVSISAPSFSGPAPLSVDFTATASDGEGPITKYEWDWNGDGTFEEDSGTDNTVSHNFTMSGTFQVSCRATDDDGLTTVSDEFTVYAWPQAYDEVEDNDSEGQANALTFPVTDITGNIGPNGFYDNDLVDWFFLGNTVETRNSMEVNITTDRPGSEVRVRLYNDDGSTLAETTTSNGSAQIRYSAAAGLISLPQYLQLEYQGGLECDYSISIETSDTPIASLTATPNSDTDDSLMVTLDATASSDSDGIVKYEFDPENTGVFIDNGANPVFNHTYTGKGSYLAVLRVTDADGYTNTNEYHSATMSWCFRRITLGTGNAEWYDEVEPNTQASPQALPAFPISNFRGSVGSRQTEYPGYDALDYDYFSFNVSAGQSIHIELRNGGQITHYYDDGWAVWITQGDGSGLLASVFDSDRVGEVTSLDYTFADAGTYQLQVRNYGTWMDYRLSATMTGP